ncbi:: DUF3168 [Gemmataceae bacterium]|nr:: DUF3168 [Gemmataceae bacterium]VTU02431.1 : DUF3168 [Gemmataceae bacterium]
MVEAILYERLSTDTALTTLCPRIRPSEPEVNEAVPFLFYTVNGREQSTNLDGMSSIANYSFTVDVWAVNAADIAPIVDRLNELLNGWRAGEVKLCRNTGHTTDTQERGYHAQESYSVWAAA